MSDEDHEVEIETDDDDQDDGSGQFLTQAEKRAHHNALERKRRDHIKESFHSLRDSIPTLHGEKQESDPVDAGSTGKASRAQILKQATEYIQFMSKKNGSITQDIDDLKRQNNLLDQQVRALEQAKRAGSYAGSLNHVDIENSASNTFKEEDTDSEDNSDIELEQRRKKLKT